MLPALARSTRTSSSSIIRTLHTRTLPLLMQDNHTTATPPEFTKPPNKKTPTDPLETAESAQSATIKGAVLNIGLSVSKFIVGIFAHSPALISDAAHSFSDIATDAVTYYAHQKAREPADFRNPFGYGKYESFGTVVIGTILIATGVGVGAHSGGCFFDILNQVPTGNVEAAIELGKNAASQGPVGQIADMATAEVTLPPLAAAAMAAISLGSKEYLYQITLAAGKAANSSVVVANAHHHRSDAMSSAVALIGIAGGMAMNAPFLDPLAGIAVAGMVIKSGYDISTEAVSELLDNQLPSDCIAELAHVCSSVPGVMLKSKRSIKAIKSGPHILVDVNITVDGSLSASSAHQIGEHCRQRCMMKFSNIREVRIHLDPDPRQEWNMHENDMLRDTPKVYEDKIRALIKRKCPDVLGVTEMVLLYEQSGFVSVRINIILHPSLSIAEANDISTLICRAIRQESVLRKDRFPIRDIDIDLELSELMEKEKGLVIVPEDKVKNWVVGSSFEEASYKNRAGIPVLGLDPLDRGVDPVTGQKKRIGKKEEEEEKKKHNL